METERVLDGSDGGLPLDAEQARQHLAEAERAEALVWISYPMLGWFWPPTFGLWFGAMVWLQSLESTVWSIVGLLVLVALMSLGLRWYVNKRGATPRGLRTAPAELHRPMLVYLLAVVVAAAVGVALYSTLGWVISAVFVTIAATIIMAVYERSYAKAAAAAARRLDVSTGRST